MDDDTRVDTLESEFAQLRKDVADQAKTLQAIQEAVALLVQNVPTPPQPTTAAPFVDTAPAFSATPTTSASGPALKPAMPNDFNGARTKGRAFLNSCELYMRLAPRQFTDDQMRIDWTLTFMKTDRASLFADRLLRYQERNGIKFANWAAFRAEFIENFCPRDEGQVALTRLETEAFYQGRRSVDEYNDEFTDLIEQAGYTDGLVIVMKYRRGLSPEIQNQVATMTVGRPRGNMPKEWYDAAALCDENRRANEAFVGTKATPRAAPVRAPPPVFRTAQVAFPTAPPRTHAAAPPALPPGVPMDIDATRRRLEVPNTCYRCGLPGHVRRDCPRQHDVRYMTDDEQQEFIQRLLAAADVRAATASRSPDEGEGEGEGEANERVEDFASRSG